MKTLKIIPIFLLFFYNALAQDKQDKTTTDQVIPDENITVNKEYDEYGNLIKYDSIYSYSYSSNGKLNDSLQKQLEQHFKQHSIFSDSFFNDFFNGTDFQSFNSDDFFYQGFINQDERIKNMMKQMDSIHQLFFNQYDRPIIPAEPEEKKPSSENMKLKQI